MTREIKFRAWNEEIKNMEYELKVGKEHAYQNCKLMQYTGLKDKNGKEIYSGDLVRTPEWNKLRVDWDYDRWALFDGICNEASIDENVEIIGNVFEGLLKPSEGDIM